MKRPSKPRTAKPTPLSFVADAPCVECGCEWRAPTVEFVDTDGLALEEGKISSACANPWHQPIVSLRNILNKVRAERLLLARLSADTPQFFNPLEAVEAKAIRDRLLKAER